jgi:metallo-beta-lactamase family protein
MHITFHGAVREVTGSMHMVSSGNDHILLDCGLFQGRRKESAAKNRVLPFDPGLITNVVLSHAHIDHSGRLPLLTRRNYGGRIIGTRVTADACGYLLPDSAHIQESDALYLNYKTVRNSLSQMSADSKMGKDVAKIKKKLKKNRQHLNPDLIDELISKFSLQRIHPLYTKADAQHALACFDAYPFRHPITIGNHVSVTLYPAGHILGSAISIIKVSDNKSETTVCYTGDLGRFAKPILKDPCTDFAQADRRIDLMIMESTYGSRIHEAVVDLKPRLKTVLNETYARGGTVVIPSFAYGRTQELLYVLHELYDEGAVAKVPIYVDSPLATNITKVFGEHPEVYDQDAHQRFLEKGKNPFAFDAVHFIGSVEESMTVMRDNNPHIVISASGMCEAGRVLHHLRYKIHDDRNTILIVGFMAKHTLGRRILEQGEAYEKAGRNGEAPLLKFMNKQYPLKARVVKLGGFSAHADRNEMLKFLKQSNLDIKRIAVVHGEKDQSLGFAEHLQENGYQAFVPRAGETIAVA